MKRKIIGMFIFMMLIATVLPVSGNVLLERTSNPASVGDTLYVGGSGLGNYSKIQDAIDNASDGDSVFVYDDSSPYTEHLNINKNIMILGENKETTKIFGAGEDKHLLLIQSEEFIISNFTIQYGSIKNTGIFIIDSSHGTIQDCRFADIPSMDAVTISNSDNIIISNCLMTDSFNKSRTRISQKDRYISGITLEGDCINTTISGNTISNASYAGIIILKDCLNSSISGNYIYSNDIYGIRAQYCNSTYIKENTIINNNDEGIAILNCDDTYISGNNIEDNGRAGVGIGGSTNTLIIQNNFIHNGFIGNFAFNLGNGFENRNINNTWNENYWGRSRMLPKPLFGIFTYQRDAQSPLIIIPWLIFDWHPAQEPYDIGRDYNEQ